MFLFPFYLSLTHGTLRLCFSKITEPLLSNPTLAFFSYTSPPVSLFIFKMSWEKLGHLLQKKNPSSICNTYIKLQRQISKCVVIFSRGPSRFSRPSDQRCSLAVMENESILLLIRCILHLLVPLGAWFWKQEQNTIFVHVHVVEPIFSASKRTPECCKMQVQQGWAYLVNCVSSQYSS